MSLENKIIDWIKSYTWSNNMLTLVVGVSGGIDSAVVSTLCAKTNIKTIVVSLPINQNKEQLSRANNHIDWLKSNFENVSSIEIRLDNTFEELKKLFNYSSDLSLANSKSRLRMVVLYHVASNNKGLVVGTGNKIEDFGIGFFTKYGDGGVDISPIADLTKSEVKKMAINLKINEEIILAKPTDGLWNDERTDEDQIGATYDELEKIMNFLDSGKNANELTGRDFEVFNIYKKFNDSNKHKMIQIPIFKK
jgi:NAD+ synthase